MGPLAVLRFLFTNIQPVDPQTLQSLCSDPAQAKECASAQLQIRAGAGGTFMAVLPSFLLLLLADGLRRGRRFAWAAVLLIQGALSVLAAITIIGVLRPSTSGTAAGEGIGAMDAAVYAHPLALVLPLLLPVLLSIVLLAARRLFPVRAPAGTYRRLGGIAAAAAGILVRLTSAQASRWPRNSALHPGWPNSLPTSRTASCRWDTCSIFLQPLYPRPPEQPSCTKVSGSFTGR